MQEAYIVAGYRTAVGKAKRGGFRFFRPDDLAIEVIKGLLDSLPQVDKSLVDDVIVGNAEACKWDASLLPGLLGMILQV
jgi:acetyl-CoA acyltransferase